MIKVCEAKTRRLLKMKHANYNQILFHFSD